MNNGLYLIHRGLFQLYIIFFPAMCTLASVIAFFRHDPDALVVLTGIIFFIPLGVFHYYAARGARSGKAWGLTMSRIIAWIMVFGFPIGTIIGVYILKQIGEKWQYQEFQ